MTLVGIGSVISPEFHGYGAIFDFATITEIEARAANEVGRIASLERACGVADNRETLAEAFASQGLAPQATSDVREPSGRALAAFLTFS